MREPRLILLSGFSTIGFDLLLGAAGVQEKIDNLTSPAISAIVLIVLSRAWFGLSIAATALAILRSRRSAPFFAGVRIVSALGFCFVTGLSLLLLGLGGMLLLPGAPILSVIGVALLVPGTVMAAAYSQAGMIVIDRGEGPFEAWQASAFLTRGYRGEILGIWLVVVAVALAATWVDQRVNAALLHLAMRVGLDAFGTCCFAAIYYELDRIGVESE